MNPSAPSSPESAVRVMRLIGAALAGGVTLFAVAAWLIQPDAAPPPGETPVLLYLWAAFATSLTAGSLVVWRGRVVPHLQPGGPDSDWRHRAARIQSGLVITWALVEAAALFGVVVYFLEGHVLPAAAGVALMWAALALTWPRPGWLGSAPATRG